MPTAIFNSLEAGIIYAIMALGVYLSFRILDFPDLTVDGSFVTGGATAAILIVNGYPPIIATIIAIFAGFAAGVVTGLLHTKGGINPLLSGILMMIALYSINLRIMGSKPNISLLAEDTIFSKIRDSWSSLGLDETMGNILGFIGLKGVIPSGWGVMLTMLLVIVVIKLLIDTFLKTEIGLALRATGDNTGMVQSFSANTNSMKVLGLGLSNGLVALSGALIVQYGGGVWADCDSVDSIADALRTIIRDWNDNRFEDSKYSTKLLEDTFSPSKVYEDYVKAIHL